MKTLVTGGCGFIGSHLVDALVARGDEVVVIDKVEPLVDRRQPSVHYVLMDIKDPAVADIFATEHPEVVFHLAASISDRLSVREPLRNAEENIMGSLNIFEAARHNGVKKIILASTGVVYGNAAVESFSESFNPAPATPYAISKYAGELYLHFYEQTYHLPYVALRFANVYGPRQDGSQECGAIAIFTSKLLASAPLFINNDGLTVRDYLYVGDAVAALLAAADGSQAGVYNCGTGLGTTTLDIYHLVSKIVPPVDQEAIKYRPEVIDETKRVVLDSSLLRQTFAWQPQISLEDGIKKTVAWYKNKLNR